MGYYFTAIDNTEIFMGAQKFENEDLIKYGTNNLVWFHVDNYSSAHVYARLPPGTTMDQMSDGLIRDCAQLVKENSIEGCKKASVTVIFTPWSNLKKTGDMAVGQVGFVNDKLVRKYIVTEKDKDVLKRLNATKVEKNPDLKKVKEEYELSERNRAKEAQRERVKQEKALELERKQQREDRSYDKIFKNVNNDDFGLGIEASTDQSASRQFEDDFM